MHGRDEKWIKDLAEKFERKRPLGRERTILSSSYEYTPTSQCSALCPVTRH
jgi:hypothetical protein